MSCVLFDLDGTLINTNSLITASFRHTFRTHLGIEVLDEEIYPYFGEPLLDTLRRFSPELAGTMVKTYRAFNLAHHDELATLFPGVKETLAELHRLGVRLGIVTSKLRLTASRGLRLFGLEGYVSCLVTIEDTQRHKPDPEPVRKAMAELGCRPGETTMVGDSPFDLRAARAAGARAVAVGWSVYPHTVLERERPLRIISRMEELLELFQKECSKTAAE